MRTKEMLEILEEIEEMMHERESKRDRMTKLVFGSKVIGLAVEMEVPPNVAIETFCDLIKTFNEVPCPYDEEDDDE